MNVFDVAVVLKIIKKWLVLKFNIGDLGGSGGGSGGNMYMVNNNATLWPIWKDWIFSSALAEFSDRAKCGNKFEVLPSLDQEF